MLAYDDLVRLLARRFDHYSVQVMVKELLEKARIPQKAEYNADDLAKIAAVLPLLAGRMDAVVEAFNARLAKPQSEPQAPPVEIPVAPEPAPILADPGMPEAPAETPEALPAEVPAEAPADGAEAPADGAEAPSAAEAPEEKKKEKKGKKK